MFSIKNIIGKKLLVTTDSWFYAPDGELYRAVFGTVNGVFNDEETLGIKTNEKSSNWYLSIGNMFVAGCQIHHAIQTNRVSFEPPTKEFTYKSDLITANLGNTGIYNADVSGE